MDTKKRLTYLIIGPVLFAIASVALKGTIGGPGAMAIGTLLWMVFWWVTQPVALTVTAFLPVGVNAIFGMVEMGDVISQYSSGSIILVFGSCLLTIPWATTGLDRRVALKVLSLVGPSMKSQITVWLLASMIFSSCLPNVAVCALFTPIAVAMIHAAGYEDIKKAEVYAKEGSYLQATQVLNQAQETAEDVEMYEPFGTVRIWFEGEREIADYHRELDLETATARVTYRNHGQSYEHRCFCSAPSQVLVYQIRAEEDAGNLRIPQILLAVRVFHERRIGVLFHQLGVGGIAGIDDLLNQFLGQLLVVGNVMGDNHLKREIGLQADFYGLRVVVPVALRAGGVVAGHINGAAHVVDARCIFGEGWIIENRQRDVRTGADGHDGNLPRILVHLFDHEFPSGLSHRLKIAVSPGILL